MLNAIAEPRRRDILRLLRDKTMSSGEISSHFEVTHAAISQHLKVLETAGLVTVHKQGKLRIYQARPEGLAELRQFWEEFWDNAPQLLKEAAETEERINKKGDTTGG